MISARLTACIVVYCKNPIQTRKSCQKGPSYGTCGKVIKQLIVMQPDDMQAGMVRLKVTQSRYVFPSNKCCFRCGSSIHLANKCNVAKVKTCQKCGKEGHFAAVCK